MHDKSVEDRLISKMRIYARAGKWKEVREIAEILKKSPREPVTKEGDKRARILSFA